MQSTPSAQLARLAALVRAPFLNEPLSSGPISTELATFAIRRHRVGPLLHVVARSADGEAAALLTRHHRDNAFRQAATDILLKEIAPLFAAAQVPWLAFKGLPLARCLYPEPTWRHSHDVDILVAPGDFTKAEAALKASGFTVINTKLPPAHWIERAMAALAKDVTLMQARSGLCVELHRRLFFAGSEDTRAPLLRHTFRPRLGRSAQDIPAPPVDAGLALYLALHGATSRWFRLKWLVDLLPLLARLDDSQMRELMDAAEAMRAAAAVKAAFILLVRVFGELPLGPLANWLREPNGRAIAEARADAFLRALDNAEASDGKSGGKRFDAFDMYYSVMDGVRYHGAVLLRGGAWIALRAVRSALPRRS